MSPSRRAESSRRRERPIAAFPAGAACLLTLCLLSGASATASGQGRFVVQGLAAGEGWVTDSGSRLLTRNFGRPALAGVVYLWAGAQLLPGLQGFVRGYAAAGAGRPPMEVAEGTEVEIELASLRYSRSASLAIEAGRILSPVGTFGLRHLPTGNPLIGLPDAYPIVYPLGFQVSGTVSRFDYRAALVSLPATNPQYVPEPDEAPHVAVGGGFTPDPSLRIGGSFTRGPYLNHEVTESLPAGTNWRDYAQWLAGVDVRFSRGHFELIGEWAWSGYDVPTRSKPVNGESYYADVKYAWTPRFFTAGRFERNNYALIRPALVGPWLALPVNFYDVELGAGYRVNRRTVVKASYRQDRWTAPQRNGRAVALQVSESFDVLSWFERLR